MKDKRTIDDVLVDFGEDFIRYASWGDDEKIDECIAQAHSEILDILKRGNIAEQEARKIYREAELEEFKES